MYFQLAGLPGKLPWLYMSLLVLLCDKLFDQEAVGCNPGNLIPLEPKAGVLIPEGKQGRRFQADYWNAGPGVFR